MKHNIKKQSAFKYSLAVSIILLLGQIVSINASGPNLGSRGLPTASPGELGLARAATAKYHDVTEAEADGYVSIDYCEPGEGCHWANFALIDGVFDAERPEFLLYTPGNDGEMRLVAVEYVVPLGLSISAPEGFTDEIDVWREDTEGAGLWELTVWLWLNNPNGMFEQYNPRVQ